MSIAHIVGTIAGTCTTLAFLPQVAKIIRTRHTSDLSLPMYVIFSIGVFMWTCYGFVTDSPPVIITNGITFVLSLYILAAKIKYK